jgi:hypothetical protein
MLEIRGIFSENPACGLGHLWRYDYGQNKN